MRLMLCLVLLALVPIASAATKSDAPPSQFIDQSIVTYPTSLGHYSLVKESYDPADVANGVSLNYELADAPRELKFDIYIYPLGRVDTTKAVTDAMVEIEGEIRTLEQRKSYADLKFDDAIPFDVDAPPLNVAKAEGKNGVIIIKSSPDATKPMDKDLSETLQLLTSTTKTTGRKRTLTLTSNGIPSESLAYVFYRNLFLISVRATVL